MRVTVKRTDLVSALRQVMPFTVSRAMLPVLACVNLKFENDYLAVSASDQDHGIRTIVPVVGLGLRGECVVSARRLLAVCGLPGVMVDIFAAGDRATVRIRDAEAALDTLPVEDFPKLHGLVESPLGAFTVPANALGADIRAVRSCISTEETRYYLNGIYLRCDARGVTLAATDGHRLAQRPVAFQRPPGWDEDVRSGIIHRDAIRGLLPLLRSKDATPVGVRIDAENFSITNGTWTIGGKLIDGTFPDIQRVIPKPEDARRTLRIANVPALLELIAPMRRAIRERSLPVILSMTKTGALELEARSDGVKLTASVPIDIAQWHVVDASLKGRSFSNVAFQARYLIAMLTGAPDARLSIGSHPDGPARIDVPGGTVGALMPMRT